MTLPIHERMNSIRSRTNTLKETAERLADTIVNPESRGNMGAKYGDRNIRTDGKFSHVSLCTNQELEERSVSPSFVPKFPTRAHKAKKAQNQPSLLRPRYTEIDHGMMIFFSGGVRIAGGLGTNLRGLLR